MNLIDWLNNCSISKVCFVNTYYAEPSAYPINIICRHHHGFFFTIEGTETYYFKDKKISAVPNSVIYIPYGEKYTTTLDGEKSIVIVLDFDMIQSDTIRPFRIKFNNPTDVKACFNNAEKIWNKKGPGYLPACKSTFYKIVSLLVKQEICYLNSKHYSKISDAVNYLHDHYLDHNFRIETLFKMSKISPRYFETLFYQEFQMSPKEYVVFLKMERGKELLLSEKISVSDVAYSLGYSDVYHFSKMFKAKTGYSPTAFRHN